MEGVGVVRSNGAEVAAVERCDPVEPQALGDCDEHVVGFACGLAGGGCTEADEAEWPLPWELVGELVEQRLDGDATARSTDHVPATPVRAGLALSVVIGLSQVLFLHPDIDWGEDDPGVGLILVGVAIGMVSVVCAMLAWKSGSRRLIRINVAALIVLGLSIVPGLFVDTTAFIRLSTAVTIVAIVVAVVLLMRRRPASARVTD